MFDEMPFLKIVASMGVADAIYHKGKRSPKWANKDEAKAYLLGFEFGKAQFK